MQVFGDEGARNRAVFLALVVTLFALVVGRMMFGFFWVVALGFAVACFTLMFAFFLRVQRNRR